VTERVLAVPAAALTDAGLFHGFTDKVDHYTPFVLDPARLCFLPRDEAEHDPTYKQLIPYLVLRHEGRVFHYRRKGGGEKRLAARRSIGIGGHVTDQDGPAAEAYRAGLLRELREEVELGCTYRERCVGLINDDRTPVGRVHLGIVHVLDLAGDQVRCKEEALAEAGFAAAGELRGDAESFETWSRFLLESGRLKGWEAGQECHRPVTKMKKG
jgi:predicted NUDIX family phosphoesterase